MTDGSSSTPAWTAGNESSDPAASDGGLNDLLARVDRTLRQVRRMTPPPGRPLTAFERRIAATVAETLLATVQRHPLIRAADMQVIAPRPALMGATEHEIAADIVRALADAGLLRRPHLPSLAERLRRRDGKASRRGPQP